MISKEQLEKEEDFNAFLESITLVDEEGKIINPVLSDDESDDPEGDREQ